MLTIFTVPKPFRGHIGVIQRNALESWTLLSSRARVIVFGDEEGAGEAAAEAGAEFVPAVKRNAYGTPLLSEVFAEAERRAASDLLVYVNADILLLPDLTAAVERVARGGRGFLVAGQRWDLDVREPLATVEPGWQETLARRARTEGRLHPPSGSDYFAYRRGTIGALPDFAVGRPGWDNWFLYHARARRLAVVDATRVTTVIHQNHDYAHVPGATGAAWEGPEADQNLALMGGRRHVFTLLDATHVLGPAGLARAMSPAHLKRRVTAWAALHPSMAPLVDALHRLRGARPPA